jgi:hypothetical protein
MRYICIVILSLACVPDAPAQVGGAAAGSSDRARLIEGVRGVAAPGSPGSLAVFARTASPLVTGTSDGGSDVAVIACGRLGRGRVVAFAHDGYFGEGSFKVADTTKLLINAMGWAAGEKPKPRVGLIDGDSLRSLFERHGASVGRTRLDGRFQAYDVLVLTPYGLTPSAAGPVVRRVGRWSARGRDRLGLASRPQRAVDGRVSWQPAH